MTVFEPDSDTVTGPLVGGAPQEPVVAVDEIQGAVLPGFGTSCQHLVTLRFATPAALRSWLSGPDAHVSTMREVMAQRNSRRAAARAGEPRPRTPVMRAIGLSIGGLRMVAADAEGIIDPALKAGMRLRSTLLGDPADANVDGHRSSWLFGGTVDTEPHVVVVLAAEWSLDLDDALAGLRSGVGDARVVWEQRGTVLPGEVEHFGFRDGVSQIGIRGRCSESPRHFVTRRWLDPNDPRATTHARPGQPLVWPGQFVFGYPAGDPHDPLAPGSTSSGGPAWTANGSLMVVRRLRQDVPAFHRFLESASAQLRTTAGLAHMTPDRLAATMVGRWPDGSALVRSPGAPDQDEATDMLGTNSFQYATPTTSARVCADSMVAREGLAAAAAADELRTVFGAPADPDGRLCPRYAHIRKVNPRDLATDQGGELTTRRLQMLRRGITWGEPYDAAERPAGDRGLIFMSYQASIVRQFELLTATWMNRQIAPEGTSGHDLLVGQATDGTPRAATIPAGDGAAGRELATTDRWIVPTGGGYFFAPSRSALAGFARPE